MMRRIKTPSCKEIRALFPRDFYTAFHARRYELLLQLIARYLPGENAKILDIGRSRLTTLIYRTFGAPVDTLGFAKSGQVETGFHYGFNLNHAQSRETWLDDLPEYDLIVFGEVLEHLHTAPELVLEFLKAHLAPTGVLIIQTPNAAALSKRVKLLLGYNPYEKIRVNDRNPGHFREYTVRELKEYARVVGLTPVVCLVKDYFDVSFKTRRVGGELRHTDSTTLTRLQRFLYGLTYAVLPPTWRPGITLVLRREGETS